jgi:anti-sigma factor (TIGR02949 family)
MDCDEVLAELQDYLHGELDTERSLHLAEHLSACSPCFARAEFQRRFRDIVRSKCRSSTPSDQLAVRVRLAIRTEHRSGPPDAPLV